jgi:hypothetical protein
MGYSMDSHGNIWMNGGSDPILVCDRLVCITDANKFNSRTDAQTIVTLAVESKQREMSYHDIPISVLTGSSKTGDNLMGKLANAGFVTTAKQMKLVQDYLVKSSQHYLDYLETGTIVSHMGWHEESFVLGNTMYSPGNKQREVKAKNQGDKLFTGCRKKGDLDEWVKITNIFRVTELRNHAFAFFYGAFGSPLLVFTELCGAVVNLYSGSSGTGKSTVGVMISSVYGDPKDLAFTAKDTDNNIFNKLGTLCNLPAYVEEVSDWDGDRISQFVYFVSGGKEKGRLTREAIARSTATWVTATLTSSNTSFYDKLGEHSKSTEGQKQRVLELVLDPTDSIAKYGKPVNLSALKNFGTAGEVYIRHLVELHGKGELVPLVENAAEDYVKVFNFSFTGAERFVEASVLTAWVGATIAQEIGLLTGDVDLVPIFSHINQLVVSRRKAYVEHRLVAWDVLTNFVARNAGKFVKVQSFMKPKSSQGSCPDDSLYGRIEYFYDAKHTKNAPTSGKLTVSYAEFYRYCTENQHPFKTLIAELENTPAFGYVRTRAYLASGLLLTQRGVEVTKIGVDSIIVNITSEVMQELNLVNES